MLVAGVMRLNEATACESENWIAQKTQNHIIWKLDCSEDAKLHNLEIGLLKRRKITLFGNWIAQEAQNYII